jgi:valyl-tRNA synthetase
MVMAGLSVTDNVPFRDVYFNALVRDEHGAKMSKSKGNVIDPLETMDNYGTDALRYSLIAMAAPGTDISLSISRLEASRNFCNKLWNAARFVQTNLPPNVTLEIDPVFGEAEYWMIGRLRLQIGVVTKAIEEFRFHEAAETLYHLVWDDFCATYIELAKTNLMQGSLEQKAAILHFLDILLRALHPIMPFVTEEIHEAVMIGRLPAGEPELLAGRIWPANDPLLCIDGGNPGLIPHFREVLSVIHRLKAENGIDPGKKVTAFCTAIALEPFAESLKNTARLKSITVTDMELTSPSRVVAIVTGGTVALELLGLKDVVGEHKKLVKERDELVKGLHSLELRLSDSVFISKAPESAIAKVRESADIKRSRLTQVEGLLQ